MDEERDSTDCCKVTWRGRSMDHRKSAYPLAYFLVENISLPLSEIVRQIRLGLCRVSGKVVDDPWSGVITGVKVELGRTYSLTV